MIKETRMKDKYYPVFIGFLLIIGTLVLYWPVQHYEFVNYDDDIYVTENLHVRSGIAKESVIWAFTNDEAGFWHPITWLSLMLDYELYRLNAGGYHWTNVLFHIGSTLLLFLTLQRMTGAVWRSGFVAALFAIHPLHVESVAWVAERKDMLSGFFWMLTMWFYVIYAERPSLCRYLPVLLAFILGLMSKSMLVTLPFVLLLLDYWPLKRARLRQKEIQRREGNFPAEFSAPSVSVRFPEADISRLILEKVPFIVLAIIASIVTVIAERKIGALRLQEIFPLGIRLANAVISYTAYIWKMIWPVHLSVYYPHPGVWPIWHLIPSCLILIFVTVIVFRTLRTYPYLAIGWLWYLGALVPVTGLIQVGSFAMADRFTYIPIIGLFIMAAWGVPDIMNQWHQKRLILVMSSCFILVSLMICTWGQVKYWENGVALFHHAINMIKGNSITFNNYGNALARMGRVEEAIIQYDKALQLQPNNPEAHNNLGNALAIQGKVNEAIVQYKTALKLQPDYIKAHFNIGAAYSELGKYKEAVFHYSEVLRLKPDFAAAYNNLGIIYANHGDIDKAILNFQKALMIFPNYDSAKNNLRIVIEQHNSIKR